MFLKVAAAGMLKTWRKAGLQVRPPGEMLRSGRGCGGCANPLGLRRRSLPLGPGCSAESRPPRQTQRPLLFLLPEFRRRAHDRPDARVAGETRAYVGGLLELAVQELGVGGDSFDQVLGVDEVVRGILPAIRSTRLTFSGNLTADS